MTRPLLILALGLVQAGPVTEAHPYGQIDWTQGVLLVEAAGSSNTGAWRDVRAVEQSAFALLEPRVETQARRIRLSADTLAGDLLAGSDELGHGLQEALADWHVAETRYYTSGKVEIRAELNLFTWLRPALAARAAGSAPLDPTATRYTGVLVDARGLAPVLSLAPRLLSPELEALYSVASLSANAASSRLPVVWVNEPGAREAIARAGEEPLFVQATGTRDGADLVVHRDDVAGLQALARGTDLLVRGAVVIVVDP